MRLFAKIFLCTTLVLSVAVLLSGYLLIAVSYEDSLERETEHALSQHQYDRFSVQSSLISGAGSLGESGYPDAETLRSIAGKLGGHCMIFSKEGSVLYSGIPEEVQTDLPGSVKESNVLYEVWHEGQNGYLLVCSMLSQGEMPLYLCSAVDISPLIQQKRQLESSFETVYFITIGFGVLLMLLLSAFLTRPIIRLTQATASMAKGKYDKRLPDKRSDEIGVLSQSFNQMADTIEDKITELSENARQKEDFAASFAHELKTPLTSVIGYADMIYQKDLPKESVKNAAWYILNEGLRLESLSLKLMDLIVLGREDFILEELGASEILTNVASSLMPRFREKEIACSLDADAADVLAEYDLLKTMMINLIDNAIKAGARKIDITGKERQDRYIVTVADNGRGIPASELNRITEAFYMVDKSRSRKQHGAGLGLALCSKIAGIHHTKLQYRSTENVGTSVSFELICAKGDKHAQA